MIFENRTWFLPDSTPVETAIGLNHLDSNFCWCDPMVEEDESGQETVVHKEVTWN